MVLAIGQCSENIVDAMLPSRTAGASTVPRAST